MKNRVYVSIDFPGVNPVGTAAVIVARTRQEAEELLREQLEERGLDGTAKFTLRLLNTDGPHALILRDGEY